MKDIPLNKRIIFALDVPDTADPGTMAASIQQEIQNALAGVFP